MLTVLHTSDLQCGRPYLRVAGDALVRFAHRIQPDVVVIAGDLTQRARAREFLAAKELMGRLPRVPIIVTPGNHDVPLYRGWERIVAPYRSWGRHISRELDTVTAVKGGTFVALNSSAPRRAVVNGHLSRGQILFAARALDEAPPEHVRALVVHHHFVPAPEGGGGRRLPRAREHLAAFEAMGVDFVLGGHVHQTHVTTSRGPGEGGDPAGVALIACGTTTSRRGRGAESGLNSLNVVRVRSGEIEVTPHVRHATGTEFEPTASIVLPRVSGASGVAAGA